MIMKNKDIFIVWVERQLLDRYRAIDHVRSCHFIRVFKPENTNIIYCYCDRYNFITIDMNMIIEIDGKPGPYKKWHGSYTEIIAGYTL